MQSFRDFIKTSDYGGALVLSVIPLVFAIPIYIWLLVTDFAGAINGFFRFFAITFQITLLFFLISLLAFKRARSFIEGMIKKPILLTMGFLVSAFFVYYNEFSMFVPTERQSMRNMMPYAIAAWLLFPIIQSALIQRTVPKWLLWVIKAPILALIFYSSFILLGLSVAAIFETIS